MKIAEIEKKVDGFDVLCMFSMQFANTESSGKNLRVQSLKFRQSGRLKLPQSERTAGSTEMAFDVFC